MTCFTPLHGFYSQERNSKTGKRSVVFSRHFGLDDRRVSVPCGQCIGCRLERSRQWAVRCVHESSLHRFSSFITLTYNDDYLPHDRSLNVEHFQRFMKRLRKHLDPLKIRFFHCGEYGEKFRRPHYHAIIFGYDFPDRIPFQKKGGTQLYVSPLLNQLWPYGFSTVGDCTFESSAYVARYVVKKRTGKTAKDHYRSVDLQTGEVFDLKPEYVTMSRRPGIASGWFDRYSSDVYPRDEVVIRGIKMRPPKFYDSKYEHIYPDDFLRIKNFRVSKAKASSDNTPERLLARFEHKLLSTKRLVRPLEAVI